MLCSTTATAQINAGIFIPMAAKFNVLNGENSLQRSLGAIGVGGAITVAGTQENSMTFMQGISLMADVRPFRLDRYNIMKVKLHFVNINPSVIIPTRKEHTHITLGIGALCGIGHTTAFTTYQESSTFYSTDIDSVTRILRRESKGVLPYVSAGVMRDIGKKLRFHFAIEPVLMDYYQPGTHINYETNLTQHDFAMAYAPVYFSMKVCYFMKPLARV